MRRRMLPLALLVLTATAQAQVSGDEALSGAPLARLTQAQDYVLRRASSYDRTGGNADYRTMAPGENVRSRLAARLARRTEPMHQVRFGHIAVVRLGRRRKTYRF
jgi:hypothetical protein